MRQAGRVVVGQEASAATRRAAHGESEVATEYDLARSGWRGDNANVVMMMYTEEAHGRT